MQCQLQTKELFARVAARDPAAMSSLFDRLSPEIRGIIQRILPSPEDAEDALESIFLGLWKQVGSQEKIAASLEAWILLTARTEAVRRLRAMKGLPDLKMPDPKGSAAVGLIGAEEIGLLQSRRELLRRSLSQLPAAQRRMLDLILFEGQTEEEIAAATHEPLGKIRDQVRAALAFTRQRIHTLMGTWTAGI